jgi:hypothetical protein
MRRELEVTMNTKVMLVAVLALNGTIALAQSIRPTYQYPAPPQASGPTSVQMGGSPFYFAPYLGFAIGHDDNLFLTPNVKKSSSLYIVSPGFKIDARSERSVFQFGYEGRIGRYSSSENDNYSDHAVTGQFDFAFDRRNFMRVGVDYLRGHEARGSTDRQISGSPDEYRLTTPNAMYAFGAPGAAGRFETYYSDARKRYTNNRATTAVGDHGKQEFGGALYVRVAPRTYAVVEARSTKVKYEQPSVHDARERRYYGGIAWDATATTTGTIKVGRFQRDFNDSAIKDFSDVSWEARVTWAPRTYSRFEFYTSRFSTESTGLGNFILSDVTGAIWTHNWTSVISTGVDLRYQKDDYQGFSRKDDTISLGLKMGYKVRRWLTLGAEYTYIKRDSTIDSADYDKNLYFLTATASM